MRTLVVLVVSFGIYKGRRSMSRASNTSPSDVEARRGRRHGRDACMSDASGRDAPPRAACASATTTAHTDRSRASIG